MEIRFQLSEERSELLIVSLRSYLKKSRFEERLRDIGARRIEIPSVGHYWVLGDIKAGEVLEL
ncbi:MAG: hypothetical protein LN415_09275 [Candidatus Thermoplasmatota archaeon]|nr:hypothetical protein [Candidatus Thermoplasmatota archaeon]